MLLGWEVLQGGDRKGEEDDEENRVREIEVAEGGGEGCEGG